MSDTLTEGLTNLRDVLLASNLPDELIERVNKFMSKKHNPKKLSKKEQEEIAAIIQGMREHNALALIGLQEITDG